MIWLITGCHSIQYLPYFCDCLNLLNLPPKHAHAILIRVHFRGKREGALFALKFRDLNFRCAGNFKSTTTQCVTPHTFGCLWSWGKHKHSLRCKCKIKNEKVTELYLIVNFKIIAAVLSKNLAKYFQRWCHCDVINPCKLDVKKRGQIPLLFQIWISFFAKAYFFSFHYRQ